MRTRASSIMDGVLVSADVKLVKPQPEIFTLLCQTFNLISSECVFIDDSPPNAEAAVYSGMKAIVFHNDIAEIKSELKRLSVNFGSQ